MRQIALRLERPTPDRFAPFGEIVLPHEKAPDFSCPEFDWREKLAVLPLGEAAEVGLVEAKNTGSYQQKTLEQHQNTVEVIVPAGNDIFLVLAKPGAFDRTEVAPEDFGAFYAPAGSMVVLREGVWHQGPMSLSDRAAAFVLYRGGTGAKDKRVLDMEELGLFITVAGL